MYKLTAILFFILFFSGCVAYKPPVKYTVEKEITIEKDYETVWNQAIEWFAINGTPIKNMDKTSGFISTEYNLSVSQTSKYMDCGETASSVFIIHRLENPSGNFNLLIKKVDDSKTKVSVNVFFSANSNVYDNYGRLQQSVKIDCNSKGQLEKSVLEFLSK